MAKRKISITSHAAHHDGTLQLEVELNATDDQVLALEAAGLDVHRPDGERKRARVAATFPPPEPDVDDHPAPPQDGWQRTELRHLIEHALTDRAPKDLGDVGKAL